MNQATLYTDGGARGNPGPAGIGFVLTVGSKPAIMVGKYIETATNNQAEYQALLAGLQRAKAEGVTDLRCFLDSELVVKQMRGEYRVKHVDLKPVFAHAQTLARDFASISFAHVPRAKNAKADKLVNEAIDMAIRSV